MKEERKRDILNRFAGQPDSDFHIDRKDVEMAIDAALAEQKQEISDIETNVLMNFSKIKSYDGVKQIKLARICLDIDKELATKIRELP